LELISNKIGHLFNIPGFFDVVLKLEHRPASSGSILRAESIFYYWLKWDCMLPLLKKMTEISIVFGCHGVFASGLDTHSLRKALFKMSTSLLLTNSSLSSLVGGSVLNPDTKARIQRQEFVKDSKNYFLEIILQFYFNN
jgi:hypothetical protein